MKVAKSKLGYDLDIVQFNAQEQKTQSNSFGGWASLKVKEEQTGGYVARKIKPGTYVFLDFEQQGTWALCFHDDSLRFSVGAGEVLFLGEFNPAPHFLQLQTNAIRSGKVLAKSNDFVHFFDDISPPNIDRTGPTAETLEAARFFMSDKMSNVNGPLRSAVYSPARFGTGRTLFGEKICGGYFNKSANENVVSQ